MTPRLRSTDETHFTQDLASAPTVLVKFTGTWCPPCRALQPTLASLVGEHRELVVLSVDVDEQQGLAQQYGVRSIPTLIAFRHGRPSGQLVGNQPRATIAKLIDA